MTLRILSAGAVTGLIEVLRGMCESKTGVRLEPQYGAVGVIGEILDEGGEFDVVISSAPHIAHYAEKGVLDGTRAALIGHVHTAMAVPAGHVHPDISSGAGFLDALRSAPEIYHPDMKRGTAGIHLADLLDRTGLHSLLEPRLISCANGATTMKHLAGGQSGAIGFAQATEILHSSGVEYVGRLPPEYALATPYVITACLRTQQPDAAESFIRCLVSNDAAGDRQRCGFV